MISEEELAADAKMLMYRMYRDSQTLPDNWDAGHWEAACADKLARVILLNAKDLSSKDQAALMSIGSVMMARIVRLAEADAAGRALLSALFKEGPK